MSQQPPNHDKSAVPTPDSEPRRPDTGSLPLPYGQETWQAISDQPVPLPDEAATRREELSPPATPFEDQPTLAGHMITPQQQKRRPRPWALWLPPALVVGVLLALFGLHSLGQAMDQPIGTPTTGVQGRLGTVTPADTTSTPQGSASATAGSTPGSATVTASSTATPRPTATPVPGQFSVSPLTEKQTCSAVLPLPHFTVTLSNQTASSVDFQVTVVTRLPGSSKPWASVSPATGNISAGGQQPVVVTPDSTLCTAVTVGRSQPFVLTVAASGTGATFTVTDEVTNLI
jgi:hypothetical protein